MTCLVIGTSQKASVRVCGNFGHTEWDIQQSASFFSWLGAQSLNKVKDWIWVGSTFKKIIIFRLFQILEKRFQALGFFAQDLFKWPELFDYLLRDVAKRWLTNGEEGGCFHHLFCFFSAKVTVNSDVCWWDIDVKSTRSFLPQKQSHSLYKWKISVQHFSLRSLNLFVGHMLWVTLLKDKDLAISAPEIKKGLLKDLIYLFKRTRFAVTVSWGRCLNSVSFQTELPLHTGNVLGSGAVLLNFAIPKLSPLRFNRKLLTSWDCVNNCTKHPWFSNPKVSQGHKTYFPLVQHFPIPDVFSVVW